MSRLPMAQIGLKLLEGLLPNVAASGAYDLLQGLFKAAAATTAVSGAAIAGAAAWPALALGVLGYVGISWYSANREATEKEEAAESGRNLARQTDDDHQRIRQLLLSLDAELTVDVNEVFKRLEDLSELVKVSRENSDKALEMLEQHEGLFISLETFILQNFGELRALLGEHHTQVLDDLRSIKDLLQKQPPLVLRLQTENAADDHQRLFYGFRQIKLRDREQAMASLLAFADAGGPRFRWWLMAGPSGVGKSRLALELCLRFRVSGATGFLSRDAPFDDWHTWQPRHPTLIVVDYVIERPEAIGRILRMLAERTDLDFPVRVLLLERQEHETWMDRLTGAGGDKVMTLEHRYHGPDGKSSSLVLPGLSNDALWSIFQQTLERHQASLPNRAETLAALLHIDPNRRPLFAAMAADAVARNQAIRHWDTQALLEYVLARERSRWERLVPDDRLREQYLHLQVLATMAQGLRRDRAYHEGLRRDYAVGKLLPEFKDVRDTVYDAIVGRTAPTLWLGLEPDILGEYLVLSHLKPGGDFAAWTSDFLDAAWNTEALATAAFLNRTIQDFPEHPAGPILCPLPQHHTTTVRIAWATSAVNRIGTFGLASGRLNEAHALYRGLADLAKSFPAETELVIQQAKGAFSLIALMARAEQWHEAHRIRGELAGLADAPLVPVVVRLTHAQGAARLMNAPGKAGQWQVAQPVYRRLVGPAGVPSEQAELRLLQAGALSNLIGALGNVGKWEEARGLYRELKAATEAHPAQAELREARTKGACNLINALARGTQWQEAQRVYIEITNLVRACPEQPALRPWQAHGAVDLIVALRNAGQWQEAQKVYRELVNLAEANPEQAELRLMQARSAANLLNTPVVVTQWQDYQDLYQELADLVGAHPAEMELRRLQAEGATALIGHLGGAGLWREAQRVYGEMAILATDHPEEAELRRWQANGAVNLLSAFARAGQWQEAQTVYRELTKLAMEQAELRQRQALGAINLILALRKGGQWREAQKVYRELADLTKAPPEQAEPSLIFALGAVNFIATLGAAGQWQVAQKAHRELTDLAEARAEQPELRLRQAQGAVDLILALRDAGQWEVAQVTYRELTNLAKAHPEEAELRPLQGRGAVNVLSALRNAGQCEAAQLTYRELAVLATAHPEQAELRLNQAQGALGLIAVLGNTGRWEVAQAVYREVSELAAAHSEQAELRLRQAQVAALGLIGILANAEQWQEIPPVYRELHELASAHPEQIQLRLVLAAGAFNLTRLLESAGQREAATQRFSELVQVANGLVDQMAALPLEEETWRIMLEQSHHLARALGTQAILRPLLERAAEVAQAATKLEDARKIRGWLAE